MPECLSARWKRRNSASLEKSRVLPSWLGTSLNSRSGLAEPGLSLGVDEMSDLRRFEQIHGDSIFHLAIRHCKPIMLSLVLCPGIDKKTLEVSARNLGIVEHAPLRCPVTPSNSLVLVNCVEEM